MLPKLILVVVLAWLALVLVATCRSPAQWHDDGTGFRQYLGRLQVMDIADVAADFFARNRRWPSPEECSAHAPTMPFPELPTRDPWGAPFAFSIAKDGNLLTVRSAGPNGVANTEDDVFATTWRATGGRLPPRRR